MADDFYYSSPTFFNDNATFFGDVNAFSDISVNGNITGNTVRVSSGKSNQFLKADGTLDSNTYLTAATLVLPSAEFLAGTTLLFYQATAPTGYTKQTTHDNKAMRVVSGTGGGSGGTTNFTSVFASRTPSGSNSGGSVSNHTLSEAEMPSHQHATYFNGADDTNPPRDIGNMTVWADNAPFSAYAYSDYRGSSNAHNHGFTNPTFTGTAMDFAVQYVDLIIASKN